ncbi:hypothetical protein [Streptomyces sp. Tu102]|uniref:hypothetical protein n=1 Tax=Streptomyces sp. Tu102 TaxID=2838019 RepID=UPI001BDD5E85|nr:hypothetical protein [Streptomyces sp. Tu102]MBT1092543.1 hypothetical protein [Streptomyces sp. Tu102]
MRRGRTRRFAVAVAVAAAVPMLGACGIRGTDVIEAGGPASFQAFLNRDTDMLLFFRAPDGNLAPVIRTVESSTEFGDGYSESGSGDAAEDPIPTEKVVLALLSGPRTEDRAAGLTSTLPTPRRGTTIKLDRSRNDRIKAELPIALGPLDTTAIHQLTCTIAYSEEADGRLAVELTGQDGTSRSGTCGLDPDSPGNEPVATQTP